MVRQVKRLVKTALLKDLFSFVTKSGDMVVLSCRIVNNKPWFNLYIEYEYTSYCFYDGDDYEYALSFYRDLMLALKGVNFVEKFNKSLYKNNDIKNLLDDTKKDNENFQMIKHSPKFLGNNDDSFF